MGSQKGITLMSLLIYVVAFLIVAGIIGAVTTFFYSNYSYLDDKSAEAAEYDKLNLVLAQESKENDNYVYDLLSESTPTSNTFSNSNVVYNSKIELLDGVNSKCKNYFDTYILFFDENFIGWRKKEKVVYLNQNVICKNVNKFMVSKILKNGHTILNVYVEFDTKAFRTKYTF